MQFEGNVLRPGNTPDGQDDHEGEKLLRDVLDNVLDKHAEGEHWTVTPSEFWCFLYPPAYLGRNQGWKMHVSATPVSAPEILERAAEVLVRHRCAFKYAKGLRQIEELVSSRADRGSGGKFITVYPNHNAHFREIVEDLHRATEGLAGPGILSDRVYRDGSLVHYRYGGFSPVQALNTEGSYEHMLIAPDGTFLADERKAWFNPPEWAPPPLEDTPRPKPDSARSKPVKLADRFVVREAIRHSYRGGVYRAVDTETDRKVIIKQARPHTGADITGNDARDWMRHESEMLDLVEHLGYTPKKVLLFDYQGDMFLAEEELTGDSLRHWCEEKVKHTGGEIPPQDAERMASALVDMLAEIHDAGMVVRDFNPGNIVVPEDDQPRLVDLEFLARQGEQVRNVFTVGYVAPEARMLPRHSEAPAITSDIYSLGATLLYLTTRIDPAFPEDEPVERTYSERLADFVQATASGGAAVRGLAPLILGLTAQNPADRWSLSRAREFLATPARQRQQHPVRENGTRLGTAEQDRLLHDGLGYAVESMNLDGEHLWPPIIAEGMISDPCNVQSGAGGVLGVLNRACTLFDDAALHDGLRAAANWIGREMAKERRVLPGLFFGRSGTAWALFDAARILGDDDLTAQATDLVRKVPTRWFNPDMTHGCAGAGTTMLHLLRSTGDPEFAERAHGCARSLIAAAKRNDTGIEWPVQEEFSSQMAGVSHYGFAHGIAGVSNFLLTAAGELDCQEYRDLAIVGGNALCDAVIRENGTALWPTGEPGQETVGLTWWCSGSAGVGTFLIRLWLATGDDRYRELAEAGATAVRNQRWLLSPTACHGASGGAEFLLDLAAALDEPRYREWAEEMAMSIHARSTLRHGKLLAPGDTMNSIEMGYNTGLAGVLGFLLRLRHGGTRMWMAEDLALPADQAC